MVASRGIIPHVPHRLGHTILEQQTRIVSEHRIPDGRFDAYACRASGDHQVLRVQGLENVVQSCFIEAAIASLVDNDVLGLRLEFVHDLGVPGITDQDPAFASIRCAHGLSISHAGGLQPVRRIGRTNVRQIRTKTHLEIDHLDVPMAGCFEDSRNGCNDSLDRRDVDSGAIEHSALAPEVILHVDDDDYGSRGIDRDRLRRGFDRRFTPVFSSHEFCPPSRGSIGQELYTK